MKFAKSLARDCVPEWKAKYIDYKGLKKILSSICELPHASSGESPLMPIRKPSILGTLSRRRTISVDAKSFQEFIYQRPEPEQYFFSMLDAEVEKISEFIKDQVSKNIEILVRFKHQAIHSFEPRRVFSRKNILRDSMLEFYRGLSLLHNFQVLNYTGVIKILKKFNKTALWDSTPGYLTSRSLILTWKQDSSILELMRDTETLYCRLFASGNRRKAMQELRIPDNTRKTYLGESWFSGLSIGAGLILFLQTILKILENEDKKEYMLLLKIYGGMLMPIVFCILFMFNMVLWSSNSINYVFVFEFDPRDHIHHVQFQVLGSFFFLMWNLFFYLTFALQFEQKLMFPAFFFFLCLICLANPFNFFYKNARFWLWRTLFLILTSAFHKIKFRDFFVTDIFCSLIFSLTSLPLFTCALLEETTNSCNSKGPGTLIFALIPAFLRLIQCLRRFYDARTKHPHLTNATKYFLSCTVTTLSFFYKVFENQSLFVLWIIFSIFTSTLTFIWDVYMDWGLLDSKNAFLRHELSFNPFFYYWAMFSNALLRAAWVLVP